MDEEQLMQLLAMMAEGGMEGPPEESGGGFPLAELGILGALGGGYVAQDPYKRFAARTSLTGLKSPSGSGRELASAKQMRGAFGAGLKERFSTTKGHKFLQRGARIKSGRHAAEDVLTKATSPQAGGLLRKAAKSKSLLSAGRLGGKLIPGLGWGLAAYEAYAALKSLMAPGKEQLEQNLLATDEGGALDQMLSDANEQIQLQSVSDQLAMQANTQITPSPDLEDLLRGHDLSGLFAQAQPLPQPSFEQALAMVSNTR